jgi:deazaflavin-dependent oxidoreductase (nitroreductase family)
MSTATNTINLGPRARRVVRLVAGFVNPLVLLMAGRRWMPVVGILHHRGRRSGRAYATPIGMRPLGDVFVIPRTFSVNAAWYQNVKAAGEGNITYLGRHYRVVEPEVVDYATAKPAFPRYELLQFRLIGINEYLRLRVDTSPLPLGSPPGTGGVSRSAGGGVQQASPKETQMDTKIAIAPKSAPRNLNGSGRRKPPDRPRRVTD